PGVPERQVQGERATQPGRAPELDFPTEQVGKLAADRQAKAGASVLAAGAGIGLLERLEDDALLLDGYADAGIRNLEGHDPPCLTEHRVPGRPAARDLRDIEAHAALGGELERVRQQVLQDLL